MLDSNIKEEIFTYWSEDRIRKAVLMNNYGQLEIYFFKNGELEATESYHTRSTRYHEDAAENYVLGIKNIT